MVITDLHFYPFQELCAQYWGEGKQTYDGLEVQMADVNSGPSYTIRAFDVTHLKVKVFLRIPKGGFQGVFKFKNKFIN